MVINHAGEANCSIMTQNKMYQYSREVGDRGITVVKVLCYKSKGRWFNP